MRDRLLKSLLTLIGWLPLRWAGAVGAAAGRLACLRGDRSLDVARINLGMCFPELSEDERERLARRNLVETGRSLAEMVRIWIGAPRDWTGYVEDNGYSQACRALLEQGRGLIIALPHLGNWELIAYLTTPIVPTTALYRPPRMAFMDQWMRQGRARSGLTPVPIDRQGLKALHAALQRGEAVAILPDQVPKAAGAAGVVAPFFGHPALTMTLVSRLARRHGAPVIFCYAVRDGAGGRYRIHHFTGDPAIGAASAEDAAAALNRDVERCAHAFPAYYQWTYKRFEMPGERRSGPYVRR